MGIISAQKLSCAHKQQYIQVFLVVGGEAALCRAGLCNSLRCRGNQNIELDVSTSWINDCHDCTSRGPSESGAVRCSFAIGCRHSFAALSLRLGATCRNGTDENKKLNFFQYDKIEGGETGVESRWQTAEKAIKSAAKSLVRVAQRVRSAKEQKRIGWATSWCALAANLASTVEPSCTFDLNQS